MDHLSWRSPGRLALLFRVLSGVLVDFLAFAASAAAVELEQPSAGCTGLIPV